MPWRQWLTKEQKARGITLQNVFQDFLEARKSLKPRTIYDYKRIMGTYLATWNNKPIAEIHKDMIAKRHAKSVTYRLLQSKIRHLVGVMISPLRT